MQGRATSRRYFFPVVVKAFILFILLSFIIIAISFHFYKTYIINKAIRFQLERLKTINDQIEHQYKKVNQIAAQLNHNHKVLKWIYSSGYTDLYLLSEIQRNNNTIANSNDELFSIDIYNARENSVLSTYSGYWREENFYKHAFGKRFIFKEFMENQSKSQVFCGSNGLYNINSPYITILYSLPLNVKLGAIAFVVQTEKVFDGKIYPNENILVLDNKNNIHYQLINDENVAIDISDNYLEYLTEYTNYNEIYIRKINYTNYYVAMSKILDNNFKIILLIPESEIIGQYIDYDLQFKVVIALLIALSLIFAYFVNKIARTPIRMIASNIKKEFLDEFENEDFYIKDEIVYLNKVFQTILYKNEEIQKQIEENKEFLIENTLRNVIFGRSYDSLYAFEFEELNFLKRKDSNFIVLVFNLDKKEVDNYEEQAISYLIEQIFVKYEGYYLRTGIRNYTIILNLYNKTNKKELIQLVQELQKSVQKRYGATISVGISDIKGNVELISQAYNEAQEALKYKAILGNNQIIDRTLINSIKINNCYFSLKEGQRLIRALRIGNEKEIDKALHDIIQANSGLCSVELLNAFFLYICSCIVQVAIEYNMKPEDIFEQSIFDMLVKYETIEERENYLKKQCKKIVDVKKNEEKRYKKISVDIVVKYIEKHYNEPISLKSLADDLSISVSYLSSLLKKELGVNFNTYITNLRMAKAKELLEKTEYNIKEIAFKVGYENEQSFIRNFKKTFTQTPSEYRNQFIEKQYSKQHSIIQ